MGRFSANVRHVLPSALLAEHYLTGQNWALQDRYGATVIYEKQLVKENLYASCGLYSPLYLLRDLSVKPK